MSISEKQKDAIKGIIAHQLYSEKKHLRDIASEIKDVLEEMLPRLLKKIEDIEDSYDDFIQSKIENEVLREDMDCTVNSIFRLLEKGNPEIEEIWNCVEMEQIEKWAKDGF